MARSRGRRVSRDTPLTTMDPNKSSTEWLADKRLAESQGAAEKAAKARRKHDEQVAQIRLQIRVAYFSPQENQMLKDMLDARTVTA